MKLTFLFAGLISTLTITSCRETAELTDYSKDDEKSMLLLRESDTIAPSSTVPVDPDPPIKDTQDWRQAAN